MAAPALIEHEALLNEASRQLAASRLRRLSRGSSNQSCTQQRNPTRVEKPRSTHNSPRAVDRRRTTTIATKRYTTLEDHWNMMFGAGSNEESNQSIDDCRPTARPVSWHPGSSCVSEAVPSPMESRTDRSYPGWQGRQFRINQDVDVSPHINQFPALDSLQAQFQHLGYSGGDLTPAADSYTTSPSWDNVSQPLQGPLDYSYPKYHMQPATWSVPDWVQMTQSTGHCNAQPSSTHLAVPQPTIIPQEPDLTSEGGDSEDSDKILVGMGLYDPPEGYDSWFTSGPRTGKGLKLEETWEPPEPAEDDDESDADENEDAENEDDASVEEEDAIEEPKPEPVVQMPTPAPTKPTVPHFPILPQQRLPVNMSGRSFLFDEEESYTNEWWYHQLKQPRAPDAGIGYGWL